MQERWAEERNTELGVAESYMPRDIEAKDAAHAAGTAAAQPLLNDKAVFLEVPEYPDPYLTFLYYQGFGQAIINAGRDIGVPNPKLAAVGVADGKSVAPKLTKAQKEAAKAKEKETQAAAKVSW